MFELKRNGTRWMPSTPTSNSTNILFAKVPSLSCQLEVTNGKARLNGGGWYTLPAVLHDGANVLALDTFDSGLFALSFTDTSDIFTDVTPAQNTARTVQSVALEFVNHHSLTATVSVYSSIESTTAVFDVDGLAKSTATIIANASNTFTINRTPKSPLYWGSQNDAAAFAFDVTYA